MKVRKKPVIVDAIQFLPFEDDMGKLQSNIIEVVIDLNSPTGWAMHTEENKKIKHEVTPKDWIITGLKGEKYPCKPDIFKETYEFI